MFLFFSTLLFSTNIFSQAELGKAWVRPIVIVAGLEIKDKVSKKLLTDGLLIKIDDPSYKVTAFSVGYDCHSGRANSPDFNLKDYQGDRVAPNDRFLNGIYVGDLLVIDNIWIEKNGKKYLLPAIVFDVKE